MSLDNSVSVQAIRDFVEVRNKLVHYDPEQVTSSLSLGEGHVAHNSRMSRLHGQFPLKRGTGLLNPFFPDKLVSVGFLAWAIFHTTHFVDAFASTCRLESHVRELAAELPPLLSQLEHIYKFDPVSGIVVLKGE